MRELYIENNHRIDIIVENSANHKKVSDLILVGIFSENPTGSAVQSKYTLGPSSSFNQVNTSSIASTFSESFSGGITGSFTESVLTEVTQSFTSSFSTSVDGDITLEVSLTEEPVCSGEYVGIILGTDINTIFSSSLSSSFFNSFLITSTSFSSESLVISASVTTSRHTTQISSSHHVTQSNTASFEIPLVERSSDRQPGVYEIISSGSFLKVSTPMTLRSVRFIA